MKEIIQKINERGIVTIEPSVIRGRGKYMGYFTEIGLKGSVIVTSDEPVMIMHELIVCLLGRHKGKWSEETIEA